MRPANLIKSNTLSQVLSFALLLGLSGACGSSKKSDPPPTAAPTPKNNSQNTATAAANGTNSSSSATSNTSATKPVYADVEAVISENCGGAKCHSQGSRQIVLVDNQTNVEGKKSKIASRVSSGSMPPGGGLSEADKELLIKFGQ